MPHSNGLASLRLYRLVLFSVLTGAAAALGAGAFKDAIAFFHNLFFLGVPSFKYRETVHTPAGPFGFYIIFAPVIGAAFVNFMIRKVTPGVRGGGVPEVVDSVQEKTGKIKPVIPAAKVLASAISIGSGGSLGREGPIIQTGASLGSVLGQIFSVPKWQRDTLLAAGAAAAIAASFKSPIGGILFSIELVLFEVSARTIIPVLIAVITGTYLGSVVTSAYPSFVIKISQPATVRIFTIQYLIASAGLGSVTGVIAALFIKAVYGLEDFLDRIAPKGNYRRNMSSMLIVGCAVYLVFRLTGHYYIEGVGYATIKDLATGRLAAPLLLIVLLLLKFLATTLTLDSGASGGIFAPAFFMGAITGVLYCEALNAAFPSLSAQTDTFAVIGMAGLLGAIAGAPISAPVIIFEITRDYSAIIPAILSVSISYWVRKSIVNESYYSMRLKRHGHPVVESLHRPVQ